MKQSKLVLAHFDGYTRNKGGKCVKTSLYFPVPNSLDQKQVH